MPKVSQEQIYDLIVSRELGWQAILYDLIKTEQLDPWDIDLVLLTRKYLERIMQLQELNEGTFFISSKVLLAAAILLRMKSEILHQNIMATDELLFGKQKKSELTEIGVSTIIDIAIEDEPQLFPRTPLPRGRKITLQELMQALERALNTEHRRIKRTIRAQWLKRVLDRIIPKQEPRITERIKQLYQKIKTFFLHKPKTTLTFTELVGHERSERITCFLPLLHLDNQGKIVLEQAKPFDEIYIWLKK